MGEPVCLPQAVSTTQTVYRDRHTEKFSQNLAAATWASGERKGRRRARDKGAPLPTTQLPSASCSRRSVNVASRGGAKGRSAAVGREVLRVYSALNTYCPLSLAAFQLPLSSAGVSRRAPFFLPPLLLLASSFCLCSLFHAARVRSQGNRRRHHVRDQKAKGGRYRLAKFCLRARRPTGVLPAPSGRPGVISTQPSRALTHADRSALTRAHHPRFSSCCLIGCCPVLSLPRLQPGQQQRQQVGGCQPGRAA